MRLSSFFCLYSFFLTYIEFYLLCYLRFDAQIAREINEGIREVYPDSAERSNINAVLSVLTR